MKKIFFFLTCGFNAFVGLQAQPSSLGLTEQGAEYGTISRYDAATNTIGAVYSLQKMKGFYPAGKMLKAADSKLQDFDHNNGAYPGVGAALVEINNSAPSPAGALNFDGSDDYVDLGSTFNYQTFTVELW